MDAMLDALLPVGNWLLPLAYLALAIDYGATFILRTRTHARNPGILVVGLVHLLWLIGWGYRVGLTLPSIPQLLSVIVLCSAAVYGLMESIWRDRRAGVFVMLLLFLLQYFSALGLAGSAADPVGEGRSLQAQLHYIPATLAYTTMVFAAVYAALYITGQRNLKKHRLGLLFDRLPPLDLLGRMSWYALLVGFGFITIAIITGMFFRHADQSGESAGIPAKILAKIITGVVTWIVCAVAIAGKWLGRWSTLRVSRFAVIGFTVVVVLFVASILLS